MIRPEHTGSFQTFFRQNFMASYNEYGLMDAAWHPGSALFWATIQGALLIMVAPIQIPFMIYIATRYISQWLMLYQMKLCGLRISQQRQLSGWRVGMSKSGWLSAIPLGLRGVSALFIALISSFCPHPYPALSRPTSSQVTIALNPTKWGKKEWWARELEFWFGDFKTFLCRWKWYCSPKTWNSPFKIWC